LSLSGFHFKELTMNINLSAFDCNDADINEFLKDNALNYQKQRVSNTYTFLENEKNVGLFFSISNDCLNDQGNKKIFTNTAWNRFHRKNNIPNDKRIKQYPAIKIGRLGIDKKLQGKGLANQLMDFIKTWTLVDHKPACRFLLLDAYNKEKQINFYQKNDFQFLLDEDVNDKTRMMYFDLLKLRQNFPKLHS
jgi:GNAT superfamily N-acetyltransferase